MPGLPGARVGNFTKSSNACAQTHEMGLSSTKAFSKHVGVSDVGLGPIVASTTQQQNQWIVLMSVKSRIKGEMKDIYRQGSPRKSYRSI